MSLLAVPDSAALHPLLDQLVTRHGFTKLDADTVDAFIAPAGHSLLVFTEDPVRYKETLDLAVIAPEVTRAFPGCFRVGVFYPDVARNVAKRYGFARWPALVLLKDGEYVGAIDGLRNWDEYLEQMQQLLASDPTRPPSVGIPVTTAGGNASACGH